VVALREDCQTKHQDGKIHDSMVEAHAWN
jgi:hypothetical protein